MQRLTRLKRLTDVFGWLSYALWALALSMIGFFAYGVFSFYEAAGVGVALVVLGVGAHIQATRYAWAQWEVDEADVNKLMQEIDDIANSSEYKSMQATTAVVRRRQQVEQNKAEAARLAAQVIEQAKQQAKQGGPAKK